MLAVGFGGYIAAYEWRLLTSSVCRRLFRPIDGDYLPSLTAHDREFLGDDAVLAVMGFDRVLAERQPDVIEQANDPPSIQSPPARRNRTLQWGVSRSRGRADLQCSRRYPRPSGTSIVSSRDRPSRTSTSGAHVTGVCPPGEPSVDHQAVRAHRQIFKPIGTGLWIELRLMSSRRRSRSRLTSLRNRRR